MESDGETNDVDLVRVLANYAREAGVPMEAWSMMSGVPLVRIREYMEEPMDMTLGEVAALANSLGIGVAVMFSEGNPEESIH